MRIVLLGSPGAGKGTQALNLSKYFAIPLISTGGILRQAVEEGTGLGARVKEIMDSGALVSDDVILDVVKQRISQKDCQTGFLLDGFPRTIAQADALYESGIEIDYIIEIHVQDEEVVSRLSGRLIHPESGRVYHLMNNPPHAEGIDDVTGDPLVHRDDDKEETIRNRLRVYHEKTEPLVKYYQELSKKHGGTPHYIQVDGLGDIDLVSDRIFSSISMRKRQEIKVISKE